MRQRDHRFEDPDVFKNGILQDGKVAVVKMRMRDGLPDQPLTYDEMAIKVIEHDAKRRRHLHVEAADNAPFSLGRPGFRHLVAADGDRQQQADIAAARQRVADARAEYLDDLTNAWRTPTANTGSHEFSSQPQEGDPCTKDGWPGHIDADGHCVIDRRATGDSSTKTLQQLQLDHRNTMSEVYRDHQTWLENQWRSK